MVNWVGSLATGWCGDGNAKVIYGGLLMFLVVDCPFNQEVCPHLVGRVFAVAPSYCVVAVVG